MWEKVNDNAVLEMRQRKWVMGGVAPIRDLLNHRSFVSPCVCVCMCVQDRVCVCVCVCESVFGGKEVKLYTSKRVKDGCGMSLSESCVCILSMLLVMYAICLSVLHMSVST